MADLDLTIAKSEIDDIKLRINRLFEALEECKPLLSKLSIEEKKKWIASDELLLKTGYDTLMGLCKIFGREFVKKLVDKDDN